MTFTLSLRIACSRLLNRIRATLLVDPAGSNNSVLYTAKEAGEGGEAISVAYATPATQATTTVAVSTNAITVTPGTKARMVVSGTLSPDITGVLFYAGENGGKPSYMSSDIGTSLTWMGFNWRLRRRISSTTVYESVVFDPADYPDGLAYGAPSVGTGTPTVTAGVSSAAQVIAAVNADAPAAALVTASASGASTGPVAEVAADFLALP